MIDTFCDIANQIVVVNIEAPQAADVVNPAGHTPIELIGRDGQLLKTSAVAKLCWNLPSEVILVQGQYYQISAVTKL